MSGSFQENMAARNLLGMRDMPVFLGNAEVAEDISFGPFVFRLSVGETSMPRLSRSSMFTYSRKRSVPLALIWQPASR